MSDDDNKDKAKKKALEAYNLKHKGGNNIVPFPKDKKDNDNTPGK